MAKLEERFTAILARDRGPLPNRRGIGKDRISALLRIIDKDQPDIRDAVFALLDDSLPSFFPGHESGRFCDGATTAHIACHIGILQRSAGKLDREGRDYWIKPLRQIGAIEPITWLPEEATFAQGHIKAKSTPRPGVRMRA